MSRLILAALLLGAAQAAGAELIDDFSASHGPFTVGPGGVISEQEAVLLTDSVLGGFRVLVPALDEEAPAGSTVTASVAGGELSCSISISASGSDSGGGCGSGYDRSDGPLFDLSGSSAFEFDITAAGGGVVLAINVFGPDGNGSIAFIETPSVGPVTIPLSQFAPLALAPVEWDRVDNIQIVVVNTDGLGGHLSLARFSTDGPIGNGEAIPGDGPDFEPGPDGELREEVYGNFYNPQRSGEGIQLTLENDGETFILTYYTYLDGEQVWLIGTGVLEDGRILFEDVSMTDGADYGSAFDPDEVNFIPWGEIEMAFIDCNRAVLEVVSGLDEFEPFTVEMQRIVPTTCGGGGPAAQDRVITGNWFDPARNGEGFQLAWEEGRFILTFYTYRDGRQVWMLGVGDRSGDTLVFPEVYVTGGADFGGRFRAEDVENTLFGEIEVILDDCNSATIDVDAGLAGFEDQILNVSKIVTGPCDG